MDEATRRLVWQRAGDRCEYCGMHQNHDLFFRFHIEHIVAKQHGGSDESSNLALACHHCNEHKGPNLSGIDHEPEKWFFFSILDGTSGFDTFVSAGQLL
jgi:5-methylcytosine-specific restriction endonuclease McrA